METPPPAALKISIRKAKPEDSFGIAQVHVQSWRETYPGIIPDEFLNDLDVYARQKFWEKSLRQPSQSGHVFVAVHPHGQILGFSAGGPSRDSEYGHEAEIYALYLLRAYHGQGIGRKLFQASLDQFKKEGKKGLYLWVLEKNKTTEIYKALGGQQTNITKVLKFNDVPVSEVLFTWET